MRTTVDISEDLLRQAKAEAAARGVKLKTLVEEGLVKVLESKGTVRSSTKQQNPTLYDLMKDSCGIVESGIDDLASNSKHMEGFGNGSIGHS